MEKYNNFFRDISKLIENGLFSSKDLKKEVEQALKFKIENIASKLNLVSREEFEVQKKILEKTQKELRQLKSKSNLKVNLNKKIKRAKKL
jgi:BMFP domain-containing protein YqiC